MKRFFLLVIFCLCSILTNRQLEGCEVLHRGQPSAMMKLLWRKNNQKSLQVSEFIRTFAAVQWNGELSRKLLILF